MYPRFVAEDLKCLKISVQGITNKVYVDKSEIWAFHDATYKPV